MTRIPSAPSVPYVVPTATGNARPARATTHPVDFESHLKAQSKPAAVPSVQSIMQDPVADGLRRPDVEAMLQALAMRKLTLYAPSKPGRTGPAASANGVVTPDDNAAEDALLLSIETINPAGAHGQHNVSCSARTEDPALWCPDSGENDVLPAAPYGSGLNTAAIAIALSGSTLIWVPCEIVRAPLQSPRVRAVRRRKALSAESDLPESI